MKKQMTTSMREAVIMSGQLSGMGREVSCTVSAIKVSLPQLAISEFVKCDILLAPQDLPDGSYKVTFEGRTMRIKKLDGDWLDGP
jgi:hypothetical protein